MAGLAALDADQVAALRLDPQEVDDELVELADGDRELLSALAGDGRLGHAALAASSGLSESTVRRRIEQLRERGALSYQVEISPVELGYRAEARLWISVRPSAVVAVAQRLPVMPRCPSARSPLGRATSPPSSAAIRDTSTRT